MTSERNLPITMESIAEDVIKQHGTRPSDIDLATRKVEEAATRRYEAAAWLRRTIGVVGAKDLPEEPSEEEFRIGLRNGIILCNVINKVQPGSIPKVVEVPIDSNVIPDGAPLSAYQHFENVRNFLVTLEHMGIPTFEASDLEKGGKSSRVVNSVLALKLYNDYKQAGKYSSSKFGGITRPSNLTKHFIRKGSDPFMNFFSQTQALPGKLSDDLHFEDVLSGDLLIQSTGMKSSNSLSMIRTALSYKKSEEVPLFVDALLHKVMQEYERRIPIQKEMIELQGNISKSKEEESTIKEKTKNELKQSNVKQHEMSLEVRELKEMIKIMEQLKLEAKPFQERLLPQQHKATTIEKNDLKEMEEKILNDLEEKPNIERLKKQQAKEIKQKALKENLIKQQLLVDHQQKQIQELKCVHQFAKSSMEYLKTYYLKEFDNLANQLCVIANAASGYHKVLEENRKLYNQIQDLKGNIRVYCRVRPFLAGQMSNMSTIVHMDDQNITICSPLKTGKDARRNFTFNKVYGPSATQEEIFLDTQPLIRSVLDGYNVCIFAYGQTGSGKTHTMSGPDELNEKTMGVNYRALNDLFYLSEQRKHTFTYAISVQMVEIYNDQVRDLLNDDSNKRLEIRNCSNKGLSVPGANLVPVSSTEEVIEIMNMGQKNRAVCYTAMNDRSSRSHSCLSIHVQGKEKRSGTAVRGSMHLVDLAGSERVEKSEVKGERLREAQHINKSLSALGDVIACLAQKSAHVPYRNSKLTQLLQDSLGGQAKTLMFVHVSPEVEALGETISTLKFAERVASVELGAARVNRDCGEVRDLKEQIAALKMELERKGSAELEDEFEELQIKKPNYKRAEDLQSLEEETKSAEWIDKAVVNNSKGGGGGDEEAVKEMRRVFYADDSDHSSAAGESSKLRRPQAKGIKSLDGIGRNLSHASRNGSTQTVVKTKRSGGIKNSGK